MLPSFIDTELVRIIRLFGELEDLPSEDEVIQALKTQKSVKKLPNYLIRYLVEGRGVSYKTI